MEEVHPGRDEGAQGADHRGHSAGVRHFDVMQHEVFVCSNNNE